MINKERIDFLLRQYVSDTLSSTEREELLTLLQHTTDDILSEGMLTIVEEMRRDGILDETTSQEIWQAVRQDPRFRKKSLIRPLYSYYRWYYCAAVAVVLIVIGFFFNKNNTDIPQGREIAWTPVSITDSITVIQPGTQQATLTLPDGQVIALDELGEDKIVKGVGFELHIVNGEIQYKGENQTAVLAMTTLRTPRGGEYQTRLPDGTEVWLNAGSSITYPLSFAADRREVYIEGEAFFDVKKDRNRPFIVYAEETSITVLGTQFNVSAYPEEKRIRTTLVEGSIRLQKGEAIRQLVPGQQAHTLRESQHITVQSVDIEEIMAWKNGYFYFHNEDIKSAMEKIARWYDVEVRYKDNMSQIGLDGTISRMENLNQLLQALQLTGTAKFALEGRRIIVSE